MIDLFKREASLIAAVLLSLLAFVIFRSFGSDVDTAPLSIVGGGEFDLGEVKQGTKQATTAKLVNTSGSNLVLVDVKTSCGCAAGAIQDRELAPGESTSIEFSFDAGLRRGQANVDSLLVYHTEDDEDLLYLPVRIRAKVLPQMVVSPSRLEFEAGLDEQEILRVSRGRSWSAGNLKHVSSSHKAIAVEMLTNDPSDGAAEIGVRLMVDPASIHPLNHLSVNLEFEDSIQRELHVPVVLGPSLR